MLVETEKLGFQSQEVISKPHHRSMGIDNCKHCESSTSHMAGYEKMVKRRDNRINKLQMRNKYLLTLSKKLKTLVKKKDKRRV